MLVRKKTIAIAGFVTVLLMCAYELYLSGIYYDKGLQKLQIALRSRLDSLQYKPESSVETIQTATVKPGGVMTKSSKSNLSLLDSDAKDTLQKQAAGTQPSDPKKKETPQKQDEETKSSGTKPGKPEKKVPESKPPDVKPKENDQKQTAENKSVVAKPEEKSQTKVTESKTSDKKAESKPADVKSEEKPQKKTPDSKSLDPKPKEELKPKVEEGKPSDSNPKETIAKIGTENKAVDVKPKEAPEKKVAESKAPKEEPQKTVTSNMPPPVEEFYQDHSKDPRYLVYLCEKSKWCGGWGDRQRGLTSVYLLARLTDRHFKISMSTPCDVGSFYAPSRVHWQISKGELDSNSTITLDGFHNYNVSAAISNLDFNKAYPQKVIYLKTNRDYYFSLRHNGFYSRTLWRWGGIADKMARFRWAWKDLMVPTTRLLTQLEHFVGPTVLIKRGLTTKPVGNSSDVVSDVGNSFLICAHVRIGKNPTIPMDGGVGKFDYENVPALFDFMASQESQGHPCKFFVGTDYDLVRTRAQKFFGDKAIGYGGIILHIDRQRRQGEACQGFEIALVEQLLMSVCDLLVLSDSGFSRYAAIISNSTTGHVYRMSKKEAIKIGGF